MFRLVVKNCEECGSILQLLSNRDIERKRFCCRSCAAKFHGKIRNLEYFWKSGNTPEANVKKGHKGENHPLWIKDRSKVKHRPRPEGFQWRNSVFKRDKYACIECKQIGNKLEAHHKAPYSLFPHLRFEVNNGITVCKNCHIEIHKAAIELFGGLNSNKFKERM